MGDGTVTRKDCEDDAANGDFTGDLPPNWTAKNANIMALDRDLALRGKFEEIQKTDGLEKRELLPTITSGHDRR